MSEQWYHKDIMSGSWFNKSRSENWSMLLEKGGKEPGWDMLIIGGGITGAGLLLEASSLGLEVALVEQRDFAWGTSSKSSKMVHGGLRYLASGDFKLSRSAVKERNRLLKQLPGLVDPLGFLFTHYKHKYPGPVSFNTLLAIYDLFAGQWNHGFYPPSDYLFLVPGIEENGLKGGTRFMDAVTDDARLVLRLIQEATFKGALAINYVQAVDLLKKNNQVCGATVRDHLTGNEANVFAKTVVNVAGAWTDLLRKKAGGGTNLRPLRGSHLVFPFWRLPVAQSVTLMHPRDRRPVFIFPWEGVTVVGTTDLDHNQDLQLEPRINIQEMDYLMEIVFCQFPRLGVNEDHIISTYSGVRPVVHMDKKGKIDPSKEKRGHSIWVENGLISVGGGKLTTFRIIARDVLNHILPHPFAEKLRNQKAMQFTKPMFDDHTCVKLSPMARKRLSGRYGNLALNIINNARNGELAPIPGTTTLWAELRWAARAEAVVHLEDLLLRRTRLGVVLANGGAVHFEKIKNICQEELGWAQEKWEEELKSYIKTWEDFYSPPEYSA